METSILLSHTIITKDGKAETLVFGRPDLPVFDAVSKVQEWTDMEKMEAAELLKAGKMSDINDFLGDVLPRLVISHRIGRIEEDGKKDPPKADFYISKAKDVLGDFPADQQLVLFLVMMKAMERVGEDIEASMSKAEEFFPSTNRNGDSPSLKSD